MHKNKAKQAISDPTLCRFKCKSAPFVKLELDTVSCKVETLERLRVYKRLEHKELYLAFTKRV